MIDLGLQSFDRPGGDGETGDAFLRERSWPDRAGRHADEHQGADQFVRELDLGFTRGWDQGRGAGWPSDQREAKGSNQCKQGVSDVHVELRNSLEMLISDLSGSA